MSAQSSLVVSLERPLDLGEVLETAAHCYRRYPALFLELTLAVTVPYTAIAFAVTGNGPLGGAHRSRYAALGVQLLESLVVTPLISALHIHALVPISRGETPRFTDIFRRGVKVLTLVAAAQVVAAIGTFIGLICLIIPGVFLSTRWAVVAQAASIEDVTWIGALRRSFELTRGSFWHVFGVLLVVSVIGGIADIVARVAVRSAATWLQLVVGAAVLTVTLSFIALSTAVLFDDLLARRQNQTR